MSSIKQKQRQKKFYGAPSGVDCLKTFAMKFGPSGADVGVGSRSTERHAFGVNIGVEPPARIIRPSGWQPFVGDELVFRNLTIRWQPFVGDELLWLNP